MDGSRTSAHSSTHSQFHLARRAVENHCSCRSLHSGTAKPRSPLGLQNQQRATAEDAEIAGGRVPSPITTAIPTKPPQQPSGADLLRETGTDSSTAADLWDSVSRFSRCKSARISEACWYRRLRSFSRPLLMISFQFGGHVWIEPHRSYGRAVQNGFENHLRAVPTEGQRPVAIS